MSKKIKLTKHSHLNYSGVEYGPNSVIEMDAKAAKQVVDAGEATYTDDDAKVTTGEEAAPKSSPVKDSLLDSKAQTERKSVSEKAQDRAKRLDDRTEVNPPESTTVLPETFTLEESEYAQIDDGEGHISFMRDSDEVSEDEFRQAYQDSVAAAAGSDDARKGGDTTELKDGQTVEVEFQLDGKTYRKIVADNNGRKNVTYRNDDGTMTKVAFLEAQERAQA